MEEFDRVRQVIMDTYEEYQRGLGDRGIKIGGDYGGRIWTPTHLPSLIQFLDDALEDGILQLPNLITVPYSGDGRESAILAAYGFNVVGIEPDKRLYDLSGEVIDDLVKQGVVNGEKIRVVHGDFRHEQAYEEAGVPFKEIPHFFTGLDDGELLQALAKKIKEESPDGARLIVYGVFEEGERPALPLGLEHWKTPRPTYQVGGRLLTANLADFLIYRK